MSQSEVFHSIVRVLSHKGHGVIDHPDGRVFFVKGTWPGDEGDFSITAGAKSYDEAQCLSLSKQASERKEIPCPHRGNAAGQCGGCPWMGIEYEAQLAAKIQRVRFLLDKNQIRPVSELSPILPSPDVFGYRNRAQFKTDGNVIGYVSEGTNILAPIESCMILTAPMQERLVQLKKRLPNVAWKPREGFHWNYLDVDDETDVAQIPLNRRRPFRQGNSKQNEAMKQWLKNALKDVRRDFPVIEAFCGSGNLTQALSQAGFQNILASEVRHEAIAELEALKLSGVRAMQLDMNGQGVWQQMARRQPHAKVLVIDPPREGVEKRRGIFKYLDNLQVIVYISCEPTTWARDVKDFQTQGFVVEQVTPMDLFPHTPHVEILSVLRKKS